jgi:hypothetical protein
MKCGVCQRDLSRDEAVYRVRTGYGSGVSIIVACSQCAKKWDREWYPAKLCCNCQRPTFVDHHRNGLRFFVCGSHCRWAVEYARRHQRPDARACAVCVQEFTPQRNNGLYCSPGCKNRAYRARTRPRCSHARAPERYSGLAHKSTACANAAQGHVCRVLDPAAYQWSPYGALR